MSVNVNDTEGYAENAQTLIGQWQEVSFAEHPMLPSYIWFRRTRPALSTLEPVSEPTPLLLQRWGIQS